MKSCSLDPTPSKLFRSVMPTLTHMITAIVNTSLQTGIMPESFKKAMVMPLLKKPHLGTQDLYNYRPVSNLPFICKIIEPVVASQLTPFLAVNSLCEMFHSPYRQFHSTETALTCVLSDILLSLDQRKAVFLVLLDLSAAFDIVDHQMLLDRLATKTRVGGVALDWIKDYLTHRT